MRHIHEWALDFFAQENFCACGATEPADPSDIAEQERLLTVMSGAGGNA